MFEGSRKRWAGCAAFSFFVTAASAQFGTPNPWVAGDASWTNGANWSLGVPPTLADQALVTNALSKTVTLDAAGSARDLVASAAGGAWNTVLVGEGGSLAVTNPMAMMMPYSLVGGSILLGDLVAGEGGQGRLVVSGGSVETVNLVLGPTNGTAGASELNGGSLDASYVLRVAPAAGASGGLIVNGGLLTSTAGAAFVEVGGRGAGSLAISNGQVIARELFVGRNAGGSGSLRIDGGSLFITNAAFYAVSLGTEAGATGSLVLAGGRFVNTNNLTRIGTLGVGDLRVYGGTALVSSLSIAGDAGSRGTFLVTNGTVSVAGESGGGAFTIAGHASATGSAVVAGGTLDFSDVQVGMVGNGTLTVSNGTVRTVTMAISTTPGTSKGFVQMSGGTVDVHGGAGEGILWVGSNGVLNVTGGTLLYDILRVQAGGSVNISGGSRDYGLAVTNDGSVSIQNSVGLFSGNVLNNGAWVTDPTTNTHLGTYVLGTNAYIQMAAGDVYIFSNSASFVNLSTNRAQTDLTVGQFVFGNVTGGTTQQFTAAGANNGPLAASPTAVVTGDWSALTLENFALGGLDFSSPSNVFLELSLPGHAWATNQALYVSNLVVAGEAQLVIPDNVSVYFISSNGFTAANYSLLGGGELHQFTLVAPIPEPSALLLVALGLAGTLVRHRRR